LEWRLPHDDRSDERGDQSNNIDCKLELEESSDVVINISSPFACFHNRGEVIILNNNISSRMSNLGSSLHGKTNICFLEGRCIVSTITSDSNNISKLSKSRDHDVFVIWSGSSKNLQLVSNLFHVLKVSNSLRFDIFAHNKNFFSCLFVHE
jgi:hypothetical protein